MKSVTATVYLRQFYAVLTQCDQVLFDNNDQARSQVLRFWGAQYIFRGAIFLSY